MTGDVEYQETLEEVEVDLDGPVLEDLPRLRAVGRDRDYRRAIEELREERRLRQMLADYDLDDDL